MEKNYTDGINRKDRRRIKRLIDFGKTSTKKKFRPNDMKIRRKMRQESRRRNRE